MLKRLKALSAISLIGVLILTACGKAPSEAVNAPSENAAESVTSVAEETQDSTKSEEIYIVYTNDVHSYIYNTITNEAGEEEPGLRMSNLAALVQDMRDEGKDVLLVDAGDEIQGDVYGAFDEGESIIELMNACGYQLATPGNHEFDYGTFALFNRIDEANYPYISCNFRSLETNELVFEPYKIMEVGGYKIAFIGITTPETITSSTPVYFQNAAGEFIYTVDGIKDKNDMYESVQRTIDSVKDDVDYVIALGHLGVGMEAVKNGISSEALIENVTGLDAFIDGHSHTVMECEKVKDKEGNEVILSQTGSYLNNIGIMKINADGLTTSLVSEYDNQIDSVKAIEDRVHEKLMAEMGEVIGELETTLYTNNPDNLSVRLIRGQEMNAGDYIADATYWYFNNKMGINCDIAFVNGGGVRAPIEGGKITYLDVKSAQPFGNMICLIEAPGQDILDALEMGSNVVGEMNSDGTASAENGGFLHPAGLKYEIDATIPSSVTTTGDGMFVSVDGEYRVKNVMVYNRQTEEYEPLELDKMYTVGGVNYPLRNGGSGLSMFMDCQAIVDFVDLDYVITAEYSKSFADENGEVRINTANSPLSKLNGYLIDYENPYGAGRIVEKY